MSAAHYLVAIDQGTSSSRTVVFDQSSTVVASAQQEFPQEYPHPGWVEHDLEDIWSDALAVCRAVLGQCAAAGREVVAMGIANQRETTLIWTAVPCASACARSSAGGPPTPTAVWPPWSPKIAPAPTLPWF